MLLSLGVVVVMMLVVVGATGLCTINPEESEYARTNPVDASTFLDLESRSTETSLRNPQLPEGWVPNSARRSAVAGEQAAVVGWVTADDGFVSSTQTGVELDDALSNFDGQYRPEVRELDVDGTPVRVLSADEHGVRELWGFDLGDARVILTGSASDEDFATVVRAFAAVEPLPGAQQAS